MAHGVQRSSCVVWKCDAGLHGVTMASLQELWISVESVPGVHGNTVCTDWMHLQLCHEDGRQADNEVLLIVGPQPFETTVCHSTP